MYPNTNPAGPGYISYSTKPPSHNSSYNAAAPGYNVPNYNIAKPPSHNSSYSAAGPGYNVPNYNVAKSPSYHSSYNALDAPATGYNVPNYNVGKVASHNSSYDAASPAYNSTYGEDEDEEIEKEIAIYENYSKPVSLVFGITLVVMGVMVAVVNLIGICKDAHSLAGIGMWGGAFVATAGALGINAAFKKTKCAIVFFSVMCAISCVMCIGIGVAAAVAINVDKYGGKSADYFRMWYLRGYDKSEARAERVALDSAVMVISMIIFPIDLGAGLYAAYKICTGTPHTPIEKTEIPQAIPGMPRPGEDPYSVSSVVLEDHPGEKPEPYIPGLPSSGRQLSKELGKPGRSLDSSRVSEQSARLIQPKDYVISSRESPIVPPIARDSPMGAPIIRDSPLSRPFNRDSPIGHPVGQSSMQGSVPTSPSGSIKGGVAPPSRQAPSPTTQGAQSKKAPGKKKASARKSKGEGEVVPGKNHDLEGPVHGGNTLKKAQPEEESEDEEPLPTSEGKKVVSKPPLPPTKIPESKEEEEEDEDEEEEDDDDDEEEERYGEEKKREEEKKPQKPVPIQAPRTYTAPLPSSVFIPIAPSATPDSSFDSVRLQQVPGPQRTIEARNFGSPTGSVTSSSVLNSSAEQGLQRTVEARNFGSPTGGGPPSVTSNNGLNTSSDRHVEVRNFPGPRPAGFQQPPRPIYRPYAPMYRQPMYGQPPPNRPPTNNQWYA